MTTAPIVFQETRLSPASVSPSSILHINTSGDTALTPSVGRKRPFDEISGLNEETYARNHLATEGSLYFRPKSKAPRSFLWRVLNDRQLLEIQCVDLVLEPGHSTAQSWLTFHIALSAPIIPHGIALADAAEKDALNIFILTSASELYTVTLRRDLLLRTTVPTNFDSSTCVKKFSSNSFTYKHAYQVVAISSLELFVSFHDGSMLRLEREKNANGAQWRETHFSEGGWRGTLKRSIPFTKLQTARYGSFDIHGDAIAAIAKSPDGKHVWTVSLDHKLKAWSTETGKVDRTRDLVEEESSEEHHRKHGSYMMDAEQGTLLQILNTPVSGGKDAVARSGDIHAYFLVVHSPKDHQFKFYGIKVGHSPIDGENITFDDAAPNAKLVPPIDELMDTNLWHLEQFAVHAGPHWRGSQLWLRARSGTVCMTFSLNFDLINTSDGELNVKEVFKEAWTVVDSTSLSMEKLKDSVDYFKLDSDADFEATVSERWLEFLLYPGRFSETSLEAALHIYRKGRNLPGSSHRGNNPFHASEEPLKARIITAVSAKIILRRLPSEQPDYDGYQTDLSAQWVMFFSVLSHLHTRRHESVGFAFDHEEGLPWTVCADYVAPIRASDPFELLRLNGDLLITGDIGSIHPSVQSLLFAVGEDSTVGQILAVARQLRRYFSPSSQAKLGDLAVLSALDQSGEGAGEDGLLKIYDDCHFQDEIRDDNYEALTTAADEFNGLGGLTDDNIMAVLDKLEYYHEAAGTDVMAKAERYGTRLGVALAQETMHLTRATLLDLLALVVFMHGDLEQDQLSNDFRPVEMYEAILLHLRHAELRLWLLSHLRQDAGSEKGHPGVLRTLYESLFWQDWHAFRESEFPAQTDLLTVWNKAWALGLDLKRNWQGFAAHVLADLLRHQETDLALDFSRFLPDGWWITYLKGRLYLAAGSYVEASFAFRECADECARTEPQSNNLLSPEELNYFHVGQGPYFQHIASLFEKLKAYSYVADFASLALDNFASDEDLQQALDRVDEKKRSKDSPVKVKVKTTIDELGLLRERETKDEVRTRLFNALVQTGRFELAYQVLTTVKNPTLQKTNLKILLQTCVKRDAIATLLELPIVGDYAQEADSILLGEAKQSMASGLPTGPPYHQILFAFRTQHSNFRGAAAILYEHLEHLQKRNRAMIQDPEDETLVQMYVMLINTLACCGDDEAWLLADPIPGMHDAHKKRKLVTLDDIRREYTAELDRRSDIQLGRFALVGGGDDEMDMF